jgi:hypothetical protein
MPDCNITSLNDVIAAQFMLNFDKSPIDGEYQKESIIWTFNVKHALEYYLSLLNGHIASSSYKSLKHQLNESLLALSQYAKNMFHILTLQANRT